MNITVQQLPSPARARNSKVINATFNGSGNSIPQVNSSGEFTAADNFATQVVADDGGDHDEEVQFANK